MHIERINSNSQELADLIGELLDELGEDLYSGDLYASLERSFGCGFFYAYGAYEDDELIGTISFFVTPKLWNYHFLVAHEVSWYVKPSYRGSVGGQLLDYVENSLECAKVDFGISDPRLLKFMLRRGYGVEKTIISKLL